MPAKTSPLIGLTMIVKNDAERLERCIDSVLPVIGTWTICDTGSDDDTMEVVKAKLGHLPGRLYQHKWQSFGHNRTLALQRAQGTARWLFMLDADMTIETDDNFMPFVRKTTSKPDA